MSHLWKSLILLLTLVFSIPSQAETSSQTEDTIRFRLGVGTDFPFSVQGHAQIIWSKFFILAKGGAHPAFYTSTIESVGSDMDLFTPQTSAILTALLPGAAVWDIIVGFEDIGANGLGFGIGYSTFTAKANVPTVDILAASDNLALLNIYPDSFIETSLQYQAVSFWLRYRFDLTELIKITPYLGAIKPLSTTTEMSLDKLPERFSRPINDQLSTTIDDSLGSTVLPVVGLSITFELSSVPDQRKEPADAINVIKRKNGEKVEGFK